MMYWWVESGWLLLQERIHELEEQNIAAWRGEMSTLQFNTHVSFAVCFEFNTSSVELFLTCFNIPFRQLSTFVYSFQIHGKIKSRQEKKLRWKHYIFSIIFQMLIKLMLSCVSLKKCVSSCWYVLRFPCLKFQTKLTSFCWIIAIYFGGQLTLDTECTVWVKPPPPPSFFDIFFWTVWNF